MVRICTSCSQDLNLMQRITEEDPLETKDGQEICPACYRRLTPEKNLELFS